MRVHLSGGEVSLCDDQVSPPFSFGQEREGRGRNTGGRIHEHFPCQAAFPEGAPRGFSHFRIFQESGSFLKCNRRERFHPIAVFPKDPTNVFKEVSQWYDPM
jgi:hypothetical protein